MFAGPCGARVRARLRFELAVTTGRPRLRVHGSRLHAPSGRHCLQLCAGKHAALTEANVAAMQDATLKRSCVCAPH